jgi:hypothetical protein
VFQTALFQATQNAETMLSLVESLLKMSRKLWMDNFYNSLALAQRLQSFNTERVWHPART